MEYTLFARTVLLLHDNHLTVIGLCLVAAALVAAGLKHWLHFPAITGYLLTGMALGPFGFKVIDRIELEQMALFSDIAIGIMLFELGRHMDWQWLTREPRLMAVALLESLLLFFAIYGLLYYATGIEHQAASLLATIGMTTSPVILLSIIGETGAEGRVSDWARLLTVVNNALALTISALLVSIVRLSHEDNWQLVIAGPVYELAGAVLLGAIAGLLLTYGLHWLRPQGCDITLPPLMLFGAILATIGAAKSIAVSPLLAVLVFGITSRNLDQGRAVLGVDIEPLRGLFVCVLFVQLGAGLNLLAWRGTALWAGTFLLISCGMRVLVPYLFAPLSGIRYRQGALLGMVLLPVSSLALLTVHSTAVALPDMDRQVAAITVAVLSVLELLGPFTTRWALQRAGEVATQPGASPHG